VVADQWLVVCYVSHRFIHRLDYATSGCLCIALTKKAARWGNKAFAKRYVTKHYLALVRTLLLLHLIIALTSHKVDYNFQHFLIF